MDFDLDQDMDKALSSAPQITTEELEITDYALKGEGDQKYIEIGLKGKDFEATERNYFNKKGLIKFYAGFEGSDGTYQPASALWEFKEAIKRKLGDQEYDKRKAQAGGINRKFFMGAKFDFEVKKSGGYVFLMTEYQKQKDQEYREANKDEVTEKQEEALSTNDLPF